MDNTAQVVDITDAVERVYREHAERLWRALVLFVGDPEVASDAVAEAFAQAIARGSAIIHVDRWVWRSAFLIARVALWLVDAAGTTPPERVAGWPGLNGFPIAWRPMPASSYSPAAASAS